MSDPGRKGWRDGWKEEGRALTSCERYGGRVRVGGGYREREMNEAVKGGSEGGRKG